MGYILPIQPYQYQDYQNRVTKGKRNPYTIEKTFKVILETQYEDNKKTAEHHPFVTNERLEMKQDPSSHHLYANLTGKGEHFNETV